MQQILRRGESPPRCRGADRKRRRSRFQRGESSRSGRHCAAGRRGSARDLWGDLTLHRRVRWSGSPPHSPDRWRGRATLHRLEVRRRRPSGLGTSGCGNRELAAGSTVPPLELSDPRRRVAGVPPGPPADLAVAAIVVRWSPATGRESAVPAAPVPDDPPGRGLRPHDPESAVAGNAAAHRWPLRWRPVRWRPEPPRYCRSLDSAEPRGSGRTVPAVCRSAAPRRSAPARDGDQERAGGVSAQWRKGAAGERSVPSVHRATGPLRVARGDPGWSRSTTVNR